MLALLLLALPATAQAFVGLGGQPPRHRVRFDTLTAGQWNPLGLQTQIRLGYRYRLFDSKSLLLRNAFVGAFFIGRFNPAFVRLGGGVEFQPLAVLTLRATYEQRLYFTSFNMVYSTRSPYEEFDEDTIKAWGQAKKNYASIIHHLRLQAVLRAKVGPVALLNEFEVNYFDANLRNGHRLFYVNMLDAMAPDKGVVLVNHAHLVYLTNFNFIFGVRYTLVHAIYPDEWLDPARGNPNTPNHRIGPIVTYGFPDVGRYFRSPTLALILNWWIDNRYRNGQKVHSGVPYGAVAFQFSGDLWSK